MDQYEVLPVIVDEVQEATIQASYTPNNGIRVQIINRDLGPDWAVFDFTAEQAASIGAALLRWSEADR